MLSAYSNSACLSTSVMPLMKLIPLGCKVETTYPARREPRKACFLRCWLAITLPCFVWVIPERMSFEKKKKGCVCERLESETKKKGDVHRLHMTWCLLQIGSIHNLLQSTIVLYKLYNSMRIERERGREPQKKTHFFTSLLWQYSSDSNIWEAKNNSNAWLTPTMSPSASVGS